MPEWLLKLLGWNTADETRITDEDVLGLLFSVEQRADTIYARLRKRFHLEPEQYTLSELCNALNRLCDSGRAFKGALIARDDRGAQRYWITYQLIPEDAEPVPALQLVEPIVPSSPTPPGSDSFFVDRCSTSSNDPRYNRK